MWGWGNIDSILISIVDRMGFMFALQNYQNEKKEGVFTANKMWTIFSIELFAWQLPEFLVVSLIWRKVLLSNESFQKILKCLLPNSKE